MRQEKGHIPYPNSTPSEELYRFGADGNLRMYSYDRLFYSLYGYDGGTTRTYKYSFDLNPNWVNGRLEAVNFNLHNAMFYPNSYINFNNNGYYTKHYYNGMERIASRLGDQNLQIDTHDPELQDRKDQLDTNIRRNIVEITGYNFLSDGEEQTIDDPKPVFELPVIGISNLQPSADGIYYYHTNHLGSTCYVTDGNASVQQGFLYAPFGEITNEYNSSFGNNVLPKYSFNAKELDEETGMYYYEARYYQPPTFVSRDPLFEEKPWLTPYHYCSNNPVGRIDPTGMMDLEDPYIIFNGKTNKLQIWDDNKTPDNYDDDKLLGEFDAHNNVDKKSNGKWEDGIYDVIDNINRFTHGNQKEKDGSLQDSPNGRYGNGGIYRVKNFKETTTGKTRSGMAIHAGREYKPFLMRVTMGCLRTTPEAMEALYEAIQTYGPFKKVIIQNNRTSTNSEMVNKITPKNVITKNSICNSLPFEIYAIPNITSDKTRVAFSKYLSK